MKKFSLLTTILALVLFSTGCASKKEPIKVVTPPPPPLTWGYVGEVAPSKWASLKPEYHMCKEGKNQSPVDITDYRSIAKKHIQFHYFMGGEKLTYQDHTIVVEYRKGSIITIDGKSFELKKFYFKTPSEHTVDGKSFPAEIAFFHQNKKGEIAILSVLIKEGEESFELAKLLKALPVKKGETKPLTPLANASALMPMDVDYYRYNGSLTTPPCSEGVLWAIFKKPITASRTQLDLIYRYVRYANNRPIQPINARLITQ